MAGIGHNSGEDAPIAETGATGEEIKQFIERFERLTEERQALSDDMKGVMVEAKARGFDTKALRRLIALRKLDSSTRSEFVAILQLYGNALGMKDLFA